MLIADGVDPATHGAGIGAAGVPEGTEIINCGGKVVAPGLVDMRAFVGEPGAGHRETFDLGQPGGGGRRHHHHHLSAEHLARDRQLRRPSISCVRRSRDTAIVNICIRWRLPTKSLAGEEMTEIGLLKAAGAVAFTDGAATASPTRW